jgi:hypothetical protein
MTPLITIVGVGALGSHVCQFLRNVDARLRIVDFDRVEQKNVASQFHGKTHLGKLKVESVKQTLGLLWGTKVDTCSSKLVTDNAKQVLGITMSPFAPTSFVIDCLDNATSRRVLQAHVRENHIPCLHGAVAADGSFGRVVWDPDFVIDEEDGAGAATCEDGAHLPFLAMVSALIARTAVNCLSDGRRESFSVTPGGVIRLR